MQLHAKLRGNRLYAGVGERFDADQLTRPRQLGEQGGQHAVDAGARQHLIETAIGNAWANPLHAGFAVAHRATEVLVAQQVVHVGFGHHARSAFLHAVKQRRILRLGWQIHRHLRATAAAQRHGRAGAADEGAGAGARIDQTALARLGVATRHRRVVEPQLDRQIAQRRQLVTRRQAAGSDVLGDQVGKQQVGRLVARIEVFPPLLGELDHGELIASIDCIRIDKWMHETCRHLIG